MGIEGNIIFCLLSLVVRWVFVVFCFKERAVFVLKRVHGLQAKQGCFYFRKSLWFCRETTQLLLKNFGCSYSEQVISGFFEVSE